VGCRGYFEGVCGCLKISRWSVLQRCEGGLLLLFNQASASMAEGFTGILEHAIDIVEFAL
jgi:hypothetical protein